ncbi:type II toxin-antitoxin system RelE/ParE family toxin [uncultured Thalassolituus sp.]|uniref:type II toxin-antitoxin system RelE/ParE family toxin n=1 Tax=uncultured Thalassolituus sp. TaxID=285273 RepID=UPI0026398E47|nr:type II toxin-antitoxin system RelE/ParE family toxin [uncultured Thalassolituus sp.]
MRTLRFTNQAESDLTDIYEYGVRQFGVRAAESYMQMLGDKFAQMTELPELLPVFKGIESDYRKAVVQKHVICFRSGPDEVVVVRVIGRQTTEQL